jgi:hypothetical protein
MTKKEKHVIPLFKGGNIALLWEAYNLLTKD